MPIKSIFQYSSIINYNFYFSEVFGNLKVPHNIYCDERIINYGIRNAKILLNSFEKKTNIKTILFKQIILMVTMVTTITETLTNKS